MSFLAKSNLFSDDSEIWVDIRTFISNTLQLSRESLCKNVPRSDVVHAVASVADFISRLSMLDQCDSSLYLAHTLHISQTLSLSQTIQKICEYHTASVQESHIVYSHLLQALLMLVNAASIELNRQNRDQIDEDTLFQVVSCYDAGLLSALGNIACYDDEFNVFIQMDGLMAVSLKTLYNIISNNISNQVGTTTLSSLTKAAHVIRRQYLMSSEPFSCSKDGTNENLDIDVSFAKYTTENLPLLFSQLLNLTESSFSVEPVMGNTTVIGEFPPSLYTLALVSIHAVLCIVPDVSRSNVSLFELDLDFFDLIKFINTTYAALSDVFKENDSYRQDASTPGLNLFFQYSFTFLTSLSMVPSRESEEKTKPYVSFLNELKSRSNQASHDLSLKTSNGSLAEELQRLGKQFSEALQRSVLISDVTPVNSRFFDYLSSLNFFSTEKESRESEKCVAFLGTFFRFSLFSASHLAETLPNTPLHEIFQASPLKFTHLQRNLDIPQHLLPEGVVFPLVSSLVYSIYSSLPCIVTQILPSLTKCYADIFQDDQSNNLSISIVDVETCDPILAEISLALSDDNAIAIGTLQLRVPSRSSHELELQHNALVDSISTLAKSYVILQYFVNYFDACVKFTSSLFLSYVSSENHEMLNISSLVGQATNIDSNKPTTFDAIALSESISELSTESVVTAMFSFLSESMSLCKSLPGPFLDFKNPRIDTILEQSSDTILKRTMFDFAASEVLRTTNMLCKNVAFFPQVYRSFLREPIIQASSFEKSYLGELRPILTLDSDSNSDLAGQNPVHWTEQSLLHQISSLVSTLGRETISISSDLKSEIQDSDDFEPFMVHPFSLSKIISAIYEHSARSAEENVEDQDDGEDEELDLQVSDENISGLILYCLASKCLERILHQPREIYQIIGLTLATKQQFIPMSQQSTNLLSSLQPHEIWLPSNEEKSWVNGLYGQASALMSWHLSILSTTLDQSSCPHNLTTILSYRTYSAVTDAMQLIASVMCEACQDPIDSSTTIVSSLTSLITNSIGISPSQSGDLQMSPLDFCVSILSLLWIPFRPSLRERTYSEQLSFEPNSVNDIIYDHFASVYRALHVHVPSQGKLDIQPIRFVVEPSLSIATPSEEFTERLVLIILRLLRPLFYGLSSQILQLKSVMMKTPYSASVVNEASKIAIYLLSSRSFLTSLYAMSSNFSNRMKQFESARLFASLVTVACQTEDPNFTSILQMLFSVEIPDMTHETSSILQRSARLEAEQDSITGNQQEIQDFQSKLHQLSKISYFTALTRILSSRDDWPEGKEEANGALRSAQRILNSIPASE